MGGWPAGDPLVSGDRTDEGAPAADELRPSRVDPAPAGIGEQLREARRRKGRSLDDCERETRINRHYLEALEAERFDALPAPVYARGFLRSYGRSLGLDGDALVARMPRDLPRPAGLEPMAGLRRSDPGAPPPVRARWLAIGGAVVAAVLILALVVTQCTGGDAESVAPGVLPGQETPAVTLTVAPTASASTEPTGTPTAIATATPTTSPTPEATPPPASTIPPFEFGTMPDFTNVEQAEAEDLVIQLGLPYVVLEAESELPAGRVAGQSPEPGDLLTASHTITLIISAP